MHVWGPCSVRGVNLSSMCCVSWISCGLSLGSMSCEFWGPCGVWCEFGFHVVLVWGPNGVAFGVHVVSSGSMRREFVVTVVGRVRKFVVCEFWDLVCESTRTQV